MKNKILLFLHLILLSSFGSAQSSLSLGDAIALALDNNYQIKIARSQQVIADNNNTIGNAGMLPSLNLSFQNGNSITDQSRNPTSFIQAKLQATSFSGNANLNWTLFQGLNAQFTKDRLELLDGLSEGNTRLIAENTIQAVIIAYYTALLQQESMDVFSEVIDLSSDRLEYLRTKKELGTIGSFELIEFESTFLSDSTNYLLQKQQYDQSLRNLNLLMGEPVEQRYTLSDQLNDPGTDYSYETLKERMYSDNQNLRNQFLNNEIATKDVALAKSNLYPSLVLSSGFGDTQSRFKAGELEGDGETINYFANFTLNFNLFNGGRTRTAIQNAKIQNEISQISTEELRNSLSNDLRTAYNSYSDQRAIYELAQRNKEISKTRMDLAEDRLKNGQITTLEYRDSQNAYRNISLQALTSLYNLNVAHTELMRLTGTILTPAN